jgi:hypothetical protein
LNADDVSGLTRSDHLIKDVFAVARRQPTDTLHTNLTVCFGLWRAQHAKNYKTHPSYYYSVHFNPLYFLKKIHQKKFWWQPPTSQDSVNAYSLTMRS